VPPARHATISPRYRHAQERAAPSSLLSDSLADGAMGPGLRRDDEEGATVPRGAEEGIRIALIVRGDRLHFAYVSATT